MNTPRPRIRKRRQEPVAEAAVEAEAERLPVTPAFPAAVDLPEPAAAETAPRRDERPPPAPPGTVLRGRFELIEVIGRGGMSTVYRAVDHVRRQARAADPEVALKVTDIGEGYQEDAAILLHREGRRLLELRHPNVVQVHDFDRDGSLHFLVMELLRGKTLAQAMQERESQALERRVALRIVSELGAGLAAVHAADMIHGDLKPGNVFITREGRVKLIDFGTAQPVLPPDYVPAEDESAFFLRRMRAVTPAYASPGTLAGQAPTPQDDIFSFAVLTYVMLAGRHPFDGRSSAAAMAEGLFPAPPTGFPGGRWMALRTGLAWEAEERPDTALAFAGRILRPRLSDHRRAWLGEASKLMRSLHRRKPVNPAT